MPIFKLIQVSCFGAFPWTRSLARIPRQLKIRIIVAGASEAGLRRICRSYITNLSCVITGRSDLSIQQLTDLGPLTLNSICRRSGTFLRAGETTLGEQPSTRFVRLA